MKGGKERQKENSITLTEYTDWPIFLSPLLTYWVHSACSTSMSYRNVLLLTCLLLNHSFSWCYTYLCRSIETLTSHLFLIRYPDMMCTLHLLCISNLSILFEFGKNTNNRRWQAAHILIYSSRKVLAFFF